jgi:replicative DNA helicase
MSENISTFTGYLGPDFQQKLFWQILTEYEFGEKIFPHLEVSYFDDDNMKRLFMVMSKYFDDNKKITNLFNKSIYHAISKYKNSRDITEEDTLNSIVRKIELWNDGVLNGTITADGDVIQTETFLFIKQQEYKKLAGKINAYITTGEIKEKNTLYEIEDTIKKISEIGDEEDYGSDLFDDMESVFEKNFRQPIPTGIDAIDEATGGGLGKGEMGIVLAASGAGKSTILTKFANSAVDKAEKNVLQIIFEDTKEQIKRKHFVLWTPKAKLSTFDDMAEEIRNSVERKKESIRGNLIIKRFPQEGITMPFIHQWIKRYEKKMGIKFHMLVLDYLDCVESHKKSSDQTQSEIAVVKYFESMAAELDIPCWSAIQSSRAGFNAEWIDATQMGGSIKRAQKSHFLMSIGRTDEQMYDGRANIKILKARFAKSGVLFENAIFDNDSMEINIYNTGQIKKGKKIDKPTIDFTNFVENENETSEDNNDEEPTFSRDLLKNVNIDEIEEPEYDDDFQLTLNKQAKKQEKLITEKQEE